MPDEVTVVRRRARKGRDVEMATDEPSTPYPSRTPASRNEPHRRDGEGPHAESEESNPQDPNDDQEPDHANASVSGPTRVVLRISTQNQKSYTYATQTYATQWLAGRGVATSYRWVIVGTRDWWTVQMRLVRPFASVRRRR